jgi:DNA-binding MarR family transcriptional regulator
MPSRRTKRERQSDDVADHLLSRAALLVRLLVRQVHDREISRSEGEVLMILTEGERRVTELAELAGLAQPSMTALVRRLERRGWVRRDGVAHDGRVVMVAITALGRAAVESFRAEFRRALRSDLDELSDEQLAALLDASETLGEFVDYLQR